MKKIYLILSVFAIVFTACETDFDVNAEWEELTVVYGLLDASKDIQFIKISKAFLGDMAPSVMAQYADSINFDEAELAVKVIRIENNGNKDTIILDEVPTLRNDGVFNDSIMLYTFENKPFLNSNSEYELLIQNNITGNEVSSSTNIISGFSFSNFSSNPKFGFYNPSFPDSSKFKSKTIEWSKSKNGEIYQLDMIFEYTEDGDTANPIKLTWSQPLELFNGGSMQSKLEGVKFFNFLSNNILDDNTVEREFKNIDLVMTVGTEDLNTYIKVNEPITGIVQQRPQFTNINNGIGIFSSRYTYTVSEIDLTPYTRDYLIDELGRNFQ